MRALTALSLLFALFVPASSDPRLVRVIRGGLSPKSVVYSGRGLFFAQNMMYSHTIAVYDRGFRRVATLSDAVRPSQFGYREYPDRLRGAPVEAAFSHGGRYAWISNYQMYGPGFDNPGNDKCDRSTRYDPSFLYRVDTASLRVTAAALVGAVPKYVAVTPDDRYVLVSNWCTYDLSVVDTRTSREVRRVRLGRFPRGIVVDAASQHAYVALVGSYDVAVVDLSNFAVRWIRKVGRSPRHLCLDPAGRYLYASLNGEGRVAKVDLTTGRVVRRVATGKQPRSMTLDPEGRALYVVNYGANTMSKVRTADMKVARTLRTGLHPIGVTYDPDARRIWVACYSGSIEVYQD